jgi:dipeptidyl aminopeptidase/acylaminoacyl peptidase
VKLWAVALDGSGSKDLLPDVDADVEGVLRDRISGSPVAAQLGGPDPHRAWLDGAAQARHDSVAHAFSGHEVHVYGRSEDGSRVIAEVEGPSHPPIYYLVDFKRHSADIVGDAYPGLDNIALGEVRSITYPARDGTAIPAYLTLPPGRAPKSLPMVVLPHGGPEARDVPEFDWLAQFFATRGYAVLQPEFRGSTGFGTAFERAGERQWGGLMQDDVTDGVKAMIQQAIADPRRICIVGGSYGGFAALAGAAFTPDLYACVVSINGVSDLPGLLMYEQQHYGPQSDPVAYWASDIGGPSDQIVIDHSPVNAAANVKAPVLLLQATDDTVVPARQAEEMASALARLGKPVSLVKLPGEDHWLSRAQTRIEVLEDTGRFLRQYLK